MSLHGFSLQMLVETWMCSLLTWLIKAPFWLFPN